MRRCLLIVMLLTNIGALFAQKTEQAGDSLSPWRLEFLFQAGTSKVLDIENYPQPRVGTAAISGAFSLGFQYDLGSDFSLAFGASIFYRQGQAWMNGTQFEISDQSIDLPVMLYSTSLHNATDDVAVFLQYGFGLSLGLLIEQQVYEIPGIPLADEYRIGAGFLDYLTLNAIGDIRIGLQFNNDMTFMVGFRAIQAIEDIDHFAVSDDVVFVPKYLLGGITLGLSRRVF
ncbi:MAG: hypothetical protein JXA28_12190 [Bacteroidetes bacterium]|nr:hypothetical protein [Bacteroidota bacterium]